jgi:transcriptional regulator with XRE-family HTH domain
MGDRLREARQARGLSLRGLADRLGVSPSLISQVENGRARPSVSTLYAIASELEISLDELLFPDARRPRQRGVQVSGETATHDTDREIAGRGRRTRERGERGDPGDFGGAGEAILPRDPVQRATTRKRIRLASGVVWERLTTESIPNVDFLYVTYEVGGASSPEHEFQRHAGQEWGYVLSGVLGVTIAFDDYELRPGDAIAFESDDAQLGAVGSRRPSSSAADVISLTHVHQHCTLATWRITSDTSIGPSPTVPLRRLPRRADWVGR